jgi:lipopolysaccharide transport system ATP-binding protein
MTPVIAKNISVDFPIYGVASRSLKHTLIRAATGGVLDARQSDTVVVRALDNLSFEFREGDRVGLVGHNGSGKSTLLRVLAGIYEPTQGSLTVNGRVTSMLSISLGMDMEATGFENIYLRGLIMGIPSRQMRAMIDDIAEFSGVGEFLHLPMRTYSSGMAMRLAFAISTSIDADIIIMDEWLSVGDAEFAKKVNARLDALLQRARIVVVASHNMNLIKNQCNRELRLEHGRIVEATSPPGRSHTQMSYVEDKGK